MTGDGVIGKLWGRFMHDNWLSKIPNKADKANRRGVHGLCRKRSQNGEYTYVLGAKVTSEC